MKKQTISIYGRFNIDGSKSTNEVKGYIYYSHGLYFCIHKATDNRTWIVTDIASGMKCGDGNTIKEAFFSVTSDRANMIKRIKPQIKTELKKSLLSYPLNKIEDLDEESIYTYYTVKPW